MVALIVQAMQCGWSRTEQTTTTNISTSDIALWCPHLQHQTTSSCVIVSCDITYLLWTHAHVTINILVFIYNRLFLHLQVSSSDSVWLDSQYSRIKSPSSHFFRSIAPILLLKLHHCLMWKKSTILILSTQQEHKLSTHCKGHRVVWIIWLCQTSQLYTCLYIFLLSKSGN